MTLADIKNALPRYVSDKRMGHVLAVEEECTRLAALYGIMGDAEEGLRRSALLHDVTHERSFEEQKAICALYGYTLGKEDLASPAVLHQFTGALVAADVFGLPEKDAAAISCHTTGKAGMTIEELILCIADFIEPTRPYDSCRELRALFYRHYLPENKERLLEECMLRYTENSVEHLRSQGKIIHPLTLEALDFYKNKLGKYQILI